MFSARKATVITGARKESILSHVPVQNSANLIAPYLNHTGRESVSRYVEALKVYAQRMSCHVMSDMTRYPPDANSQSPSAKEATRSPSAPDTDPTISAMSKEIEDLRSRLSQVSSQSQVFGEASDSDTEPIQANECSTPVSSCPLNDPAEDADPFPSDSPNHPGLASYELRSSSEEDRLFEAMLPYVPYTIAPIVMETFEICHGIDPRSPSAILTHLLSMCQLQDPASVYQRFQSLRLSLSAPTVDEAVTSYITEFLKLVRLCPSPLPESARMKFFSNEIRPDKLKMIIKTDIEVGTIYSFASLVSRLRELLPAYHLPYSAYYANRDIAPPPPRDSRPPRRSSTSPRTTRHPAFSFFFGKNLQKKSSTSPTTSRHPPRNSSSHPAPSSAKPSASSHSQRSSYSTPARSSSVTCFYCKEPGHVIKDCPKSGCKASQKPRRRPLGKKPSLQRKHFTRRSVTQVTHAAHDDRPNSVNSIIDSIQEAIQEDDHIDATYLHGLSSSSSSSDNEPYNATLNPFSTINHSTYSSSLHQHPAIIHQQTEDFQHLFNNLESITSALAPRNNALISPYPSPSDSGLDSSSDSLSEAPEVVSKVDSNSHMVPPGNAPSRQNGSLLLEASPDLSSEPGMIDADCARYDGGVTCGPMESHFQNSSKAKDSEPLGTAPAQSFEPSVSLSAQELNKPLDKKLLHLKIYVDPQTMLNGMVDTGATVSCISHDLLKQAKLNLTTRTLEVGLADKTKLSCPLATGKLAFALGGAAKLTYVDVTLAVLPCSNSCIIGCDLLRKLGILTPDYLFLNLSAGNLQILEDEAIPDEYIPSSNRVSSVSSLPDLDKTIFKLNDPELENSVRSLLFKYPEIFSKLPDPQGIDCPPMRIPFHDESKIVSKKYRYLPPDKLKVANEEFDTLINNGFAVPYDGPWSSPICLVQRPDKPPRLTGDYSGADGVNELSISVPADLPRISDVCHFLSGSHYIATLDLPKAFWQLNLHPDDQEKSAIAIPGRKIKYTRAAFGLKNVPAIFQNLMKKVFKSDGVFIYMDDIIVAASDKKSFLSRIEFIFKQAAKYRIRIGLHKCSFQTKEHPIKVLGSIFENGQRRIDPSKIVSITKLAPPSSVPELRSFIGSVNFLRDWLPSVSAEIEPLTALLRNKPRRVRLGPAELKNFENIKNMITRSLPLALPDSDSNILISTDASEKAIAGIIWKELEPSPPGTCLSKRKNLVLLPATLIHPPERVICYCNDSQPTQLVVFPAHQTPDNLLRSQESFIPSPYGEQLYDWSLHPRFHKHSDLPSCNIPIGPLYPDSDYKMYLLNPCIDVTTYIPLCLLKPVIHRIYHYDDDELTPCSFAIPGIELVYGHQIDPSDRSIHYYLKPLDYSSLSEVDFNNPDPDFIHVDSITCPHFPNLLNLYFNGPIQHHSRLDFILQDKHLEIVPHPTRSYAFALPGFPADQPRYYLPSSRSELPSRLEIFEADPAMFNHERFLKEQSMSPTEDLPSREDPNQPIDISSDSSDEVHFVSTITSSSTSDSSVQELLPSGPPSSPVAAFLNKIFKDQQKVPDNDPLFKDCIIEAKSGLKLNKSGKILIPPSTRPEILLLVHGSIEAGHPPFVQCWKSLQQSDFHWPNMRNDLQTHVSSCIPCQKTAPVPKTSISSTGSLNSVRRPFESLHCDSIGPLSADTYGYKYVVHFVDAFSKFSILVPTKDLKATTIVNALISSVYSVFGAPRSIHSDNGPEFANKIFSLLCQFLNIEHTQSLPHYHQSNGLVERQHRSFLQVIRRMLLDFSDYHNWSDYVPHCQMGLNSQERKALNSSPYPLIFGSDTSPRLLPNQLLNSLSSHPLPADKPEFIEHLVTLTKKLSVSWDAVIQSSAPPPVDLPEPPYIPQVNDRVFVLREKPDKLHGHFVGPYTVLKVLSSSSLLVQNPVSGSPLKTAIHLVKPCLSSLPPEILNAYVAADSGELILDAIIDISDDSATVLWSDGTTTVQPVSSIRNTAAYSRYTKLAADPPKPRRRRKRRQC
ncbi:hypothetical protein P9112_005681 [Eukaryota sp. TZLM1-RC]